MDILEQFLQLYHFLAYPIVAIGMFVEGTLTLLLFGALSHSNSINLLIVFLAAIFGETLHDMIFWWIGNKIRKKREKYNIKKFKKITKFLEKSHSFFSIYIFISKFIWNLNRITIVSAGYSGMKFKKFIKISFISILLWVTFLLSIGYVFADQTQIMKQKLWVGGVYLFILFVFIIIIQVLFRFIIKNIRDQN